MDKKRAGVFAAILVAVFFAVGLFKSPEKFSSPAPAASSTEDGFGSDVSLTDDWTLYKNEEQRIAVAYPIEFSLKEGVTEPGNNWRADSTDPGEQILNIRIPSSFEPNTNFLDANFNIGISRNPRALEKCLSPDPSGPNNASGTAENINNVGYIKFLSMGAGAGNLYEVTSWRTIRGGACYAFEGIIHSAHVENYPAEENRKEFDREKLRVLLEEIMKTAVFL